MKQRLANKGLYIGTGAGLILFALVGLLPGSLIGGIVGLKVAGLLVGTPVKATVVARIIVAVSMVIGLMVAAAAFVVGTGILGWIIGAIADVATQPKEEALEKATQ